MRRSLLSLLLAAAALALLAGCGNKGPLVLPPARTAPPAPAPAASAPAPASTATDASTGHA
ncbi:LPS translocon maturation chaperone LptM [Rhodanobacter lindaniclasticus]